MLAFVVPLRSPGSCHDWRRVSALCERTLRSLCAQTDDAFSVTLACAVKPEINFAHPKLEIVTGEFPVPRSRAEQMEDKYAKLRLGMREAQRGSPTHVMLADADDLVSNRLAALVRDFPHGNGWAFQRGYIHDEGRGSVFIKDDFDRFCGTSAIVRVQPGDLPSNETDGARLLEHGHPVIAAHLAEIRRPLDPLPFIGSIYVAGSGENYSGFSLASWQGLRVRARKLLWTRPLTAAIRREFGLYPID